MPRKTVITTVDSTQPMKAALTPEARENQMIALAMDLVERRLREGTASSQETTHFLKLASTKEQLERKKLEAEIELNAMKVEAIKSSQQSEEMYAKALAAMRTYSGSGSVPDNEEEH